MTGKPDNATYLFEKHKNKSEQWWTAIFSLLLTQLGKEQVSTTLPLFRCLDSDPWFGRIPDGLDLGEISLSQVNIEAALPAVFPELWGRPDLPSYEYWVKPDVIVADLERKRAAIIEVKTIGAQIGKNFPLYQKARDALKGHGYQVALSMLVSEGHTDEAIWTALRASEVPVILWEDMLCALDKVDWLRGLFDEDLKPYYSHHKSRFPELNSSI